MFLNRLSYYLFLGDPSQDMVQCLITMVIGRVVGPRARGKSGSVVLRSAPGHC